MSKPQRRKGNAKTASSAQAADLLGTKGFVGFDIGFSNVFESVDNEFLNLDNEVVVILKKLSKKDCQTREKALRELFDYISSQTVENIEGTFGYYVNAFPKLALDGSPTVRQLSLKSLTHFISKLKKSAEKHLKKLIPFVLICTCDVSPVVAGIADELLKSCFPEGKSAKVIQLFAEDTANVCCEFVTQQHVYFSPQKYDEEESALQRESRLLTQCLNLLSKLADKSPEVATTAQQLFNNPAQLKKFLSSASPQVHAGLLNLTQRLPSSFNFVDSPIAQFSLSNLDNADATVGTCCFNVLHLFISEHKESFFKKFDVKKALAPRLLTIVRKKSSHWRYCGQYLLPSFAAIHDQLPPDEAVTFGLSLLISFTDNMPFNNATLTPSNWSSAFLECFKYFTMQIPSSSAEQLVPIAINTIDKADLSSDAVQTDFVAMVKWICEKRTLSSSQIASFINNLELNLMNKRPETDPFIIRLLALGLDDLVSFHVDILQSKEVPTAFITALEKCQDKYFQKISQGVHLLSLVNNEGRQLTAKELKSLAVIILRLFQLSPKDEKKVEIRHDLAVEVMKEKNSQKEEGVDMTALMERLGLGVQDSAVFLTLLETSSKKNANIYVDILKTCEADLRRDIMKTVLAAEDLHVIEFVVSAYEQIEWDKETEELITTWMWMEFFHLDNKNFEVLGKGMETGQWEPPLSVVREFMPVCCSDMPSSLKVPDVVRSDFHESKDCLYLYSERFLRLCETQEHIYEAILVSPEFLRYVIERADYLLARREMSLRNPVVDCAGSLATDVVDEDIFSFVDRLAPAVSLYVALLRTDKYSREVQKDTLALLQVVDAYLELINSTEYLRHKQSYMSEVIKEFFQAKSFRVTDVLDVLMKEPVKNSPAVHAALQNIYSQYPEIVKELQVREDLPVSICWALRMDISRRKMGIAERFITRFYCEDTEVELISHLHDYCSQEGSTWPEDARLFSAKAKEPYMCQLNLVVLKAAAAAVSTKFEMLSSEQLDFVMCGLVSTFESLDDIYTNDGQLTVATEALLGNALLMFRACSDVHARLGSLVFSEWKEFYYPFMSRVIVRIWSKLSITEESPSTLPLLELCRAVYNLKEIPADLDLYEDEAVDEYKYEPHISTLVSRCVKGLQSGHYLNEFASLKLLLLLAPKLFRLENGEWNEEEEVVAESGPKQLAVPEPFTRITGSKTLRGFVRFAAIRAALEPLMSDELAEEEKLLYCESFPPLVNAVLPELIQAHTDLPSDSSLFHTVAGHPRDYILSIITDICSLIPAVVRTWYNGLPKQASFIVNKFVSENVSRKILTNELNKVKEEYRKIKKDNEMKVSIVRVARQIVAEYVVDETKMVLTITMPENYPLGVPEIDLEKACVPTPRAKKWLLQLTAYLFYQNGSIVNGIQMWKKNVDKDVEGAEACCICMYTIHSNTHQLPRVNCKQCKNKFHAACLYKWFESSNNTQCPLCRTTFT